MFIHNTQIYDLFVPWGVLSGNARIIIRFGATKFLYILLPNLQENSFPVGVSHEHLSLLTW